MKKLTREQIQKQSEQHAELFQKRMDECDGDYSKYIEKYNRHTLNVSLLNEQTNSENWEGSSITFFNQDNAIHHLSFVNDLLDFLIKDENKGWGTRRADKELVERAICFVREYVSPPERNLEGDEEDLIPLTQIADELKEGKK